ncbi:hypothetical protein LCGC14_2348410 [marine sediment metagenome]|uniref:DNA ligase OB-like domain-containing protein n=1 Tax=marine sediment metagenome TaxID=412755 RepID=A0A0F9C9T1_9ZZZZ
MKQDYLMLAHVFKPGKHSIGGWFLSEKLDGSRCFWDGGVSRGVPAINVPWANIVKDGRLLEPVVATGLWSRSGKVIYAPNDWLDQLPKCPLDGELFMGRGGFQKLRRTVAEHSPSENWKDVKFMVFDSPSLTVFRASREIKIRSEYSFFVEGGWFNRPEASVEDTWTFEHTKIFTEKRCVSSYVAYPVPQEHLPLKYSDAVALVNERLDVIVKLGGEGVMLRNPASRWVTQRSHNLLKVKPSNDAEGIITGFTSGRATDRGSKLRGLIGALVLDYNGKRLELSGLTDAERSWGGTVGWEATRKWAWDHPGEEMPETFQGKYFKVGDIVSFKYRELSDDGIPKEARYFRKP